MSILHKIPPLVSALAFGYGVGMAAPDSTIRTVHAAVSPYAQPAVPREVVYAPAPVMPPPSKALPVGAESRELLLMRQAAETDRRGDGASCDLDRPSFSKAPRYESRPDATFGEADDLDAAGTEALSRLQMPDMKVTVTRRTLKYVRFFAKTDRGRGMFETWLKRSGKYQDLIQTELRHRRLPEDLIWVSMIESGFDPRAKSPAGAVGLWQFMPATGQVYGLYQNRFIDQRKNPKLATQAAAHHLRDLYLRFGNWELALAAYNMGYEQLLDAIDRYGTTDFNELVRQDALPSETSSYVPKIIAAAIVANNLDRFGFEGVELTRPIDTAEIAVPPGTPLKTIAKGAGVPTSLIRSLNPDILGEKLPPGRGDFLILIPSDTLSKARAALPALLENEPVETDASVLDPVSLLGGREVRPRADSEDGSLLSLLPHPKKRRSMRDSVDGLDGDDDDDGEEPFMPRRKKTTVIYRVGAGDTLSGIAKHFGVDGDDVARENHVDASEPLKSGQLLTLHVRKDALKKANGDASKDADSGSKDATRDKASDAAKPEPSKAIEHADKPGKHDAAPSEPRSKSKKKSRAKRDQGD